MAQIIRHIAILALACCSIAASAQDTLRITIRDVAGNYGLRPEYIDDTTALQKQLEQRQPQDFARLSQYCHNVAKSVETMISDLSRDYRDSLVWFDNNHVLINFDSDKLLLQQLAAQATQLGHVYDSLEVERQAIEAKKARERALAEERRIRAEKEALLGECRDRIAQNHRNIATRCNDGSITDRTKIKELKDIYYAYLSIYNKYDLTSNQDLDQLATTNKELEEFQIHLQDSVLGENSYPEQIARFKDELKIDSEKFPAVYKSYSRLFKRINVPVSFANLNEYDNYIMRLRETRDMQEQYRISIEELAKIDINSDNITSLYGKRYREISQGYRTMLSSMDFTPAFLTALEGAQYIQKLASFQEVQKRYIANYNRLEAIQSRGESITNRALKKYSDVTSSYKELVAGTSFVATFKTIDGADLYSQKLDNFESMQAIYEEIITLRQTIDRKEDSILTSKIADKYLTNGYKTIKKNQNFTPHFITAPQGEDFVNSLNNYIDIQNAFLNAIDERQVMLTNAQEIKAHEVAYPNTVKAYNKLAKTYSYYEIVNAQDLARYAKTQQRHIATQHIFMDAIGSVDATSLNQQLKRVTDPEKIRLILKIVE